MTEEEIAKLREENEELKSQLKLRLVKCYQCNGTGGFMHTSHSGRDVITDCPNCKGSGKLFELPRQLYVAYKCCGSCECKETGGYRY